MDPSRFATAISCIDGRFIERTVTQLQTRFGAKNIDLITTAGAVKHLADSVGAVGEGLLANVDISVEAHDSSQLAVVAHDECAGNPVSVKDQKDHLRQAAALLETRYPHMAILTLFLDPKTGFEQVR